MSDYHSFGHCKKCGQPLSTAGQCYSCNIEWHDNQMPTPQELDRRLDLLISAMQSVNPKDQPVAVARINGKWHYLFDNWNRDHIELGDTLEQAILSLVNLFSEDKE